MEMNNDKDKFVTINNIYTSNECVLIYKLYHYINIEQDIKIQMKVNR